MSVLVLGGDKIDSLRSMLSDLGVESIVHWTARNQKKGRKKDKPIPSKISMVIMLTNFLNHNAMRHYRAEAKSKGLPVVYGTRSIECTRSAFVQALYKMDKDAPICKQCENYIDCYKEQ